jgi:pimeloyl-ACP methyl ester carboxylesterase
MIEMNIVKSPKISPLLINGSGDSPTRIPGWRLTDAPENTALYPDDKSVPILETSNGVQFVRTPDSRFEHLPNFPYKPHYTLVDGLRIHYVEAGPREGEVVLLLHGQPTWAYLYRKMIPIIANAGFRAIAMDHIGMGRSDKPIDIGIHTFEQHVAWQKQFIASLGLKNITVFCQDWGSLIGLRVAGDLPQLFARLVVANGTLPVLAKGNNPFKVPNPVVIDPELGDFSSILPKRRGPRAATMMRTLASLMWARFFQKWIRYALTAPEFTPSQVVQAASHKELSPAELAAYDAPYPSFIYKAAVRTFPSMIAAIEENNAPAWETLGTYTKPFLFLGGELDHNMGRIENQHRLTHHIPGAQGQEHERYPNAAHFIQEDEGEGLGHKVVAFMKQNPQASYRNM